jgi:hypothetical protein
VPQEEFPSSTEGYWIDARNLRVGDSLLQLDGQRATVQSVFAQQTDCIVYNLNIDQNHTYCVSERGVLVHNRAAQVKPVPTESQLIEKSKVTLEAGKQGKHIPGHNNYIPGRSPLTHKDPQALLDKFAGKGEPVGKVQRGQPGFKERVDFGEVIGQVSGNPTTKGIIHYSKDGAHIVPANP